MPSNYSISRILNVDDNDGARYAKSRVLKHAGFDVIEAANGEDALRLAAGVLPNLILLDVKLPDINGFEVCRRLKGDPTTQAILILQTSASFLGIPDKIKALDGGADNYLFEPIEPEELIANVRALLRLGKVERELRDVDRRKDEFLATLAHELRNPLAPIRNALELMRLLDPVVPEKQEKARQIIQRHTDHLVRLVDDLLDISRISQGKINLVNERVALKNFIGNACELSAPIVKSRNHIFTLDIPEEPIWIDGDSVRLTQIVANLLHNAAKFTPVGGAISPTAYQLESNLVICVSDNGIGISEDSLGGIFELFAQVGHAQDRVQDGLGIGLSLVKNLVKMHRGEVCVSSEGLGKGCVFKVQLPLAAA